MTTTSTFILRVNLRISLLNFMNQPIIKQIKPINFLFHQAELKISDLTNQIPIAKELIKESVRLDLHPSGPIPLALLRLYGR